MHVVMQERRGETGRTKSEKCSCSLSLVDSGAYHIICFHGQDQFAIVGYLSGPGRLRPFSFLQSLLTSDLTVSFPAWETRAGTPIHCGLVELLPHSEGDVGGADCG